MSDKKVIEIKNVFLVFIKKALEDFQVDDKTGFARRRFLRMLNPFLNDLDAEQKELQLNYFERTESGDFKVANSEPIFKNPIVRKAFEQKWEALNDQTFKIDVSESNEMDIRAVAILIGEQIELYKENHKPKDKDGKIEVDKAPIFNGMDYDFMASLGEFKDLITL